MQSTSSLLVLLILETFCQSSNLIVKTNYGKVSGVVKTTRNNGTYVSFAGIPFAKPPVGDLRFANPQKPKHWSGVRDGSKSGPRCIQRNYLFYNVPPIEGSEDCLYLNVYIPVKNRPVNIKKLRKLPVIVSIPWGGFIVEGGDEGYFGPEYLLDYDVILVSFNYRVGIFGFLSTLDDAAPGNLALKDQVLALQWVQENIKYFGGIKENVTIMGQSAGAGSTHLHMLSPSSRGLFSKAISQSGTALGLWAAPFDKIQKIILPIQAVLVNCLFAIGNSTKLIDCLRNVRSEDLLQTQDFFKIFYRFPYTAWPPVIEKRSKKNPDPFLEKTPVEYIESDEFQKVPWLTGQVKNEGLVAASALLEPAQVRNNLNKTLPIVLFAVGALSKLNVHTERLYQSILHEYLDDKFYISNDEEWEQGFINLWSDILFTVAANESISKHVANGHDSIYFYNFEYAGEYTFAGIWSGGNGLYNPNWTISHCDELLYLFRIPDLFENQLTSKTDQELSKILLNLWVNFAIYGNPNPPGNVILEGIEWKPLQPSSDGILKNDDIQLLNISGSHRTGANFNITRGFYKERIALWQSIIPKIRDVISWAK